MPKNEPNPDKPWALLWADIAKTCGAEVATEIKARHLRRVREAKHPPDVPKKRPGRPKKSM